MAYAELITPYYVKRECPVIYLHPNIFRLYTNMFRHMSPHVAGEKSDSLNSVALGACDLSWLLAHSPKMVLQDSLRTVHQS